QLLQAVAHCHARGVVCGSGIEPPRLLRRYATSSSGGSANNAYANHALATVQVFRLGRFYALPQPAPAAGRGAVVMPERALPRRWYRSPLLAVENHTNFGSETARFADDLWIVGCAVA